MTNFEKIKAMTIEEYADMINTCSCETCPCDHKNYKECFNDFIGMDCYTIVLRWLNEETHD